VEKQDKIKCIFACLQINDLIDLIAIRD